MSRTLIGLAAAQSVRHGVGGYPMQPVDEGSIGAVGAQSLVNLDEDVLRAVLCGGLASKGAKGDVQDSAVVAFDQLTESVVVPREASRNELALLDVTRRRNCLT